MRTMLVNKLFKWVSMLALVGLLGVPAVRAVTVPQQDFVAGQYTTNSSIWLWGSWITVGSGPYETPLTNWSQVVGPSLGPDYGQIALVQHVAPSATLSNNGTAWYLVDPNNYPTTYPGQLGTPNAPYFGSYYEYFPTNQYWYGLDVFQVSTPTIAGLYWAQPISLVITNIMDVPVATANAIFVGDVDHCANVMKTGSVAVVAMDWDNYPLTNDLTYGLTYKFIDGSQTQETALGMVTLTNNQLYVDVTNAPPTPLMTNLTVTVRVRDEASRPVLTAPYGVYTNGSGANNTNDYTDLLVNIYYIYRNNHFVGAESNTQDVMAYGFTDLTNYPPTALTDWSVAAAPQYGTLGSLSIVPVDGYITNNWPYYGTQTWWGTHFTYTPNNSDWWGLDSLTVSNANGDVYSISIAVTNVTDLPVASACDIYVLKTDCTFGSSGTTPILATDLDNLYTNASDGLVYSFPGVTNNELGYASLDGSNLTFTVTNPAAQPTPIPYVITVRVTDGALRTYNFGCTNYPDATGANDPSDFTDIPVNVYNLYGNPAFAAGEGEDQTNILAWFYQSACALSNLVPLTEWSIFQGPYQGSLTTNSVVAAEGINGTNNWPYYGTQTWWGTHFTYHPANSNWYGLDTVTVTTVSEQMYDIVLAVTNTTDLPQVDACDLFVYPSNCVGFTAASTVIVATDADNLNPADALFTFTFQNGATVWSNILGEATLSGSNLTFVVTNIHAPFTPAPYILPIRVQDVAVRPSISNSCVIYPDATGVTDPADYQDHNVELYNFLVPATNVAAQNVAQEILAWSNAPVCQYSSDALLYSWSVVSGPNNGTLTATNIVAPDVTNNWPHYGTQPWWGTHFTYVPNTNWYGTDTVYVAGNPNLVQNGTFDADLNGWTLQNNDINTHWYSQSYQNGNVNFIWATLYQDVVTVPGQTYQITFDFENAPNSPDDDLFFVTFGDELLMTNDWPTMYQTYSYQAVATSTTTRLSFVGHDDPDFWYVDNVSIRSLENLYTNVIQIVVTNLMDLPVAFDTNLTLMVCAESCGSLTSSVQISSWDVDNLPQSTNGLVYVFGDGSFVTNTDLGIASLTNDILYFAKTNTGSSYMTNVIGVRVIDFALRPNVTWECDTYQDVSGTNALDGDGLPLDVTDIFVTVNYTSKNFPALVAAEPVKLLATNESPYEIYEGEAVRFSAVAMDFATNNAGSAVMQDCMWGVTGLTWNVYTITNILANLVYTETMLPTTLPAVRSNGVSELPSSYTLDTSSDRWFRERLPLMHTYTAIVEAIAYDLCGNPSVTNWAIVVHPTLETPVISIREPSDVVLGDRGTLCAWDHNSNEVFFAQVAGPGGITLDGNGGTNCVGFTASTNGKVTVKTFIYRDNQAMAGDPQCSFEVLIGTNIFAPKVISITGANTNESNVGEIQFSGPPSTLTNAWPAGTVLSISAVPTAFGLTNNGGYSFTRWEIPTNAFTTALNVYDRSQSSTIPLVLPSGLTTNAIGGLQIIAIFKRTAELAVPVVDCNVDVITNALPCAKVGKGYGPYIFTNSLGTNMTVAVQSEDLPGLEAVGLPTGMVFSASIGATNYPGGGVTDTNINYTTFTNLTLSGIPTNVGTYSVTVYATNAYWHAGWRDDDVTNDVLRAPGNTETNRDVVFRFTITVVSQELAQVVSASPVLTNALALAKDTKPYVQAILGTDPLLIESDSAVTLQLSVLEQTGLSFTYLNTSVTTNGQANCYGDTYRFDDLVISGVPTNVGTFTLTLQAVNATGTNAIGTVALTVLPLVAPIVERAPLFLAPIARVDREYDYTLGTCADTVCRELLVWSECEPLRIYATNLPAGLNLSVTTEDTYDSSYNPNNWSNAFYYTCVRIYGTPTVATSNVVTIVAENCAGSTNIVWDDIVVKPHEVQAPVWTNLVVTDGKQNCAYSYDFTSLLQPVTVKSDLPATLRIDGLPAGIVFTFGGGQTALGSAANEYLDTYQFSGLKIQGTAPGMGTYTGTLVAVSSATQSTITVFTLVIRPQTLPVFKNPAIFAEAVTQARSQWAYDFTFANALVVYSDNSKPVITVTGLPLGLTNSLVGADSSAANGDYGTDYSYGRLRISGTTAVAGTNTITVTASNEVGSASQTFTLVVMPQTTVVDAKTFTTTLVDAKSNWVYEASLPDVDALKSDTAVTLVLSNALPTGLAFTYAVQKTSNGAAPDYRDTYTFNELKIAGTPTQTGVFTNTLVARNTTGDVVLSANFTLTVAAQAKPVFQNPDALNNAVTPARLQWAYSFDFSNDLSIYSDDPTAPTLTVTGLPTGLTAQPLAAAAATESGYGKIYTFGKLKISGTPTANVGTNTISVVAQNANGVTTQTFSLVVMPQTTVVDAKTFTTTLVDAKSNRVYEASLPDVDALKSDTAVTLVLSNALPTGLAFTYAVQKTSNGAAPDYRDTYTFNALKIAGTPTQTGVFTNTLVARNTTGDVVLSANFTLTVLPQHPPVFKNPAIFNQAITTARENRWYEFIMAASMVVYSDEGKKPAITVTGLPTGLAWALTDDDSGSVPVDSYGVDYTMGKLRIYGTPTQATNATVVVTAVNAGGSASKSFTLQVLAKDLAMVPSFITVAPDAKINKVYVGLTFPDVDAKSDSTVTLQVTNLPAGLTFAYDTATFANDATASGGYRDTYRFTKLVISGTPTEVRTNVCGLVAINDAGTAVISTFTLVVKPLTAPEFISVPWMTQPLSTGRVGRVYNDGVNAYHKFAGSLMISSDNSDPQVSVVGLPRGLNFNFGTRVDPTTPITYGQIYKWVDLYIGGTPETNGTFTVHFIAQNSVGATTNSFTLLIKPHSAPILVPPVTTPTLPNGKITKSYSYTFPGHPVIVKSDIPVTLEMSGLPADLAFTYDMVMTAGNAFTDNLDTYVFTNLKIEGTPVVAGTFYLGVVATNGVAPNAAIFSNLQLIIDPATVTPVPSGFTNSGTFNGWAASGSFKGAASMTVVVKPGLTNFYGSFKIADQGYTFQGTANSLTQSVDGVWMIYTTILVGAERMTLCMQISGDHVFAIDGLEEKPVTLDLFRNRWDEGAVPSDLVGYYTMAMPALDGITGSGFLTLTVASNGAVKAGGKLGDGTAVSLSATLIAAGGNRTAPFLVVVNPPVPTTYNNGFVFGVAEIVEQAGGLSYLRLFEGVAGTNEATSIVTPSAGIVWVNNNPMATANYNDASTYGDFTDYRDMNNHGFVRMVGVSGGRYSTTELVKHHYCVGTIGEVQSMQKYGTSVAFASAGLSIATNAKSHGLYLAPKADSPKLVKDVFGSSYDYENDSNRDGSVNGAGLTFSLNNVTGIYGGSFKQYFEKYGVDKKGLQTVKQTAVKVNYQGVMLPVRADVEDGVAGRGHFLLPDTSTYDVNESARRTYKFNWSYDFTLSDQVAP